MKCRCNIMVDLREGGASGFSRCSLEILVVMIVSLRSSDVNLKVVLLLSVSTSFIGSLPSLRDSSLIRVVSLYHILLCGMFPRDKSCCRCLVQVLGKFNLDYVPSFCISCV